MFGHETRIAHFFAPLVMFLIGGMLTLIQALAWVGYLVVGLGGFVAYWLYKTSMEKERTNQIRQKVDLYATLEALDAQTRATMGLEPAKSTTRVIVDKTPLNSGYMEQAWVEAPIPPWKLKQFAKGIQGGRPFHIREWTPLKEGKLFSDNEWRILISFLKRPDPTERGLAFIVQRHPTNERRGFDWTEAGEEWISDILDAQRVLMPQAQPADT